MCIMKLSNFAKVLLKQFKHNVHIMEINMHGETLGFELVCEEV